MLAHNFQRFLRAQLNKRAVKSLEYGMLAMVVFVAALGAASPPAHVAAAKPVVVASIN